MIGKLVSIFLIYIGTWFYTVASFYHLKMKHWTFWKAYLLAIPLVLFEYVFNIFGNKYANANGLAPMQIMTCIIGFYMLNIWIFNLFILKQKNVVVWREILAVLLLVGAILISTNVLTLAH